MGQTSKTWKAGRDTLVVTIPQILRRTHNIEEGDIIEIDVKLIQKNNEKKEKTKEKPKETNLQILRRTEEEQEKRKNKYQIP